ncbi:hypothetical protein HYALB_00001486 [Hymenoscyphus albidus]|uniref:Uncharacterized protein n=1 Tax=Hymenoscyphus albidus TaxID=595503 RepID=A0A9N9LES7_9HELO|nr:hypothetical protein HYALB_00001486 [Hymenoscyphus albidus]
MTNIKPENIRTNSEVLIPLRLFDTAKIFFVCFVYGLGRTEFHCLDSWSLQLETVLGSDLDLILAFYCILQSEPKKLVSHFATSATMDPQTYHFKDHVSLSNKIHELVVELMDYYAINYPEASAIQQNEYRQYVSNIFRDNVRVPAIRYTLSGEVSLTLFDSLIQGKFFQMQSFFLQNLQNQQSLQYQREVYQRTPVAPNQVIVPQFLQNNNNSHGQFMPLPSSGSSQPPSNQQPQNVAFRKLPAEIRHIIYANSLNIPSLAEASSLRESESLHKNQTLLATLQVAGEEDHHEIYKLFYEKNVFIAAFHNPGETAHRQHSISCAAIAGWPSQRPWMANNYTDSKILSRLSKIRRWLIFIRADDVQPPRNAGIISFCHALSLWDTKCKLHIETMVDPKEPTRNMAQYQTELGQVLDHFTYLRLSSLIVRIATSEESSQFPKRNLYVRHYDGNVVQSELALENYKQSSCIMAWCLGDSPRRSPAKVLLNCLSFHQAFEMDVSIKCSMAVNEDGAIEHSDNEIDYQSNLGLAQKGLDSLSKTEATAALRRARIQNRNANHTAFEHEITTVTNYLFAHYREISAARENQPRWFDSMIFFGQQYSDRRWHRAQNYVQEYSNAFFRYYIGGADREKSRVREVLKGIKQNLGHEKLLRQVSSLTLERGVSKLRRAFEILEKQWGEVEEAKNQFYDYEGERWDYQLGQGPAEVGDEDDDDA